MKSFEMNRLRALLVSLLIGFIGLCFIVASAFGATEKVTEEAARLLPDKIENLLASQPAAAPIDGIFKGVPIADFAVKLYAARTYRDDAGHDFQVEAVRTENDASAYALLTRLASGTADIKTGLVGIASIASHNRIAFCKGDTLIQIESNQNPSGVQDQLLTISQAFALTLPNGDDEIPVLVEHLPNWQSVSSRACYAVSLHGLKSIVANQPILDALGFEGGTEAVAASYGQSQLVIVEFTTPQFAGDNDRRLTEKIQELKSQNQPGPTAYRRVGNYSVLVFNGPNEKTAIELIDQVKYQKVVQWLGEDPHLYEKLQRYFANTTTGVLIAVLESSGLSLLICLGLGSLIGALLFRHRRAQRTGLYSDAGGSIRLNLDELTASTKPNWLLESSKQTKPDAPSPR